MNVDEIRSILDLVREHELTEFELESEGLKLKVRKTGHAPAPAAAVPYHPLPAVGLPAPPPAAAAAPKPAPAETEGADLAIVKSPIVGTLYRAPEPGAPPFAEKGAIVKKGQVLCIIEAMKMMNQIESDKAGRITSVMVQNGEPVEFGQPLFTIE